MGFMWFNVTITRYCLSIKIHMLDCWNYDKNTVSNINPGFWALQHQDRFGHICKLTSQHKCCWLKPINISSVSRPLGTTPTVSDFIDYFQIMVCSPIYFFNYTSGLSRIAQREKQRVIIHKTFPSHLVDEDLKSPTVLP